MDELRDYARRLGAEAGGKLAAVIVSNATTWASFPRLGDLASVMEAFIHGVETALYFELYRWARTGQYKPEVREDLWSQQRLEAQRLLEGGSA